jgi:hypothetical protein
LTFQDVAFDMFEAVLNFLSFCNFVLTRMTALLTELVGSGQKLHRLSSTALSAWIESKIRW